jgi:hypothetical protein
MRFIPAAQMACVWAIFGLTACAGFAPIEVGMTMAQVREKWGTPTQVHTTPTGARMIFSVATHGHHVYVVDVDKQGKMIRQYDAMSPSNLAKIRIGLKKWEVEREIGPAFWYSRYQISSNTTGIYKYQDVAWRRCFYVEYDSNDVVATTLSRDEQAGRDLLPGEREC